MNKSWIALAMLLVIAVHAEHAVAQEQDAEGCKDSPIVTRFPGSVIHSCDTKEFERAEMPVARIKRRPSKGRSSPGTTEHERASARSKCFETSMAP